MKKIIQLIAQGSKILQLRRMFPDKFLPFSGINHDEHRYFCLAPMMNSLTSLPV